MLFRREIYSHGNEKLTHHIIISDVLCVKTFISSGQKDTKLVTRRARCNLRTQKEFGRSKKQSQRILEPDLLCQSAIKIIERNLNIGQPIKALRWCVQCNVLYAMRSVRDAPPLEKSSLFKAQSSPSPACDDFQTRHLRNDRRLSLSHACLKKGNRRHFHARHAFVPSRMTPSPKHLSLRDDNDDDTKTLSSLAR